MPGEEDIVAPKGDKVDNPNPSTASYLDPCEGR